MKIIIIIIWKQKYLSIYFFIYIKIHSDMLNIIEVLTTESIISWNIFLLVALEFGMTYQILGDKVIFDIPQLINYCILYFIPYRPNSTT